MWSEALASPANIFIGGQYRPLKASSLAITCAAMSTRSPKEFHSKVGAPFTADYPGRDVTRSTVRFNVRRSIATRIVFALPPLESGSSAEESLSGGRRIYIQFCLSIIAILRGCCRQLHVFWADWHEERPLNLRRRGCINHVPSRGPAQWQCKRRLTAVDWLIARTGCMCWRPILGAINRAQLPRYENVVILGQQSTTIRTVRVIAAPIRDPGLMCCPLSTMPGVAQSHPIKCRMQINYADIIMTAWLYYTKSVIYSAINHSLSRSHFFLECNSGTRDARGFRGIVIMETSFNGKSSYYFSDCLVFEAEERHYFRKLW